MFCDIVFFLNDFQRYIFICKRQNSKSAKSIDFHIICDFHNRFSTIFAEKPSLFKRHFLAEPSSFCRLGDGDFRIRACVVMIVAIANGAAFPSF
jgi:hypothetical protein